MIPMSTFQDSEMVLYNGTKAVIVHVYRDEDGVPLEKYEIEYEDINGQTKVIMVDERELEPYKGGLSHGV